MVCSEARKEIWIDGETIRTVTDVRRQTAGQLGFDSSMDKHTLWGILVNSGIPITIYWRHANISRERLGPEFNAIVFAFHKLREIEMRQRVPIEHRFIFHLI